MKYVESLLPKGKRCEMFLWTGECNPDKTTLEKIYQAGLLNMNGGDTTMSRMNPTLTAVAPLGIPRDEIFQVYAPNQNENMYTNLWTGPFYGYERAIETFQLTDKPLRLKPINIYYHTYSASKPASLKALKKVYDWALSQPVLPLHASAYARKVLDFNEQTLARDGDGWRIAGGGETRTLRIPKRMGYPDLSRSENILGWWDEGDIRYVHLAGAPSSLLVLAEQPVNRPWLARANGRISPYSIRLDVQRRPASEGGTGGRRTVHRSGRWPPGRTAAQGEWVRIPEPRRPHRPHRGALCSINRRSINPYATRPIPCRRAARSGCAF